MQYKKLFKKLREPVEKSFKNKDGKNVLCTSIFFDLPGKITDLVENDISFTTRRYSASSFRPDEMWWDLGFEVQISVKVLGTGVLWELNFVYGRQSIEEDGEENESD